MVNYRFEKMSESGDRYADYEHLSDVQTLYFSDIMEFVDKHDWQNEDDILQSVICQIYAHEDFHAGIENLDIDTLSSAQHEIIYPILHKWLTGRDDSSLGY